MRDINATSDICRQMVSSAGATPLTIKCRLGVDDADSYEGLHAFVSRLAAAGVGHFIVHARKAILNKKFSPKQNREIPPLNYSRVYRLVKDFPWLSFVINGGFKTYEQIEAALEEGVVGVMVGREIHARPWYWGDVDRRLFGSVNPRLSRREILTRYAVYAAQEYATMGSRSLCTIISPIMNLFEGVRGAKKYRQAINDEIHRHVLSVEEIIREAMRCIDDAELDVRWP
eukprot:gnl/TRDRNA2_/TRDRNA2_125663_c1_seq1.p1 gnl/TRDRNA2_/TRDRNA2_125663_c1~~gnl/TRDRNA2_/TRDRNA2_125663_c1_seq1.p1  ORF type:complete len:256 (+),score=25.11 gnl/TRDRNA2_/TRDRNA2_125663_c1_seq1:83-769(+)